jgi:ATP-dependent RNA helicase SUPV3L1/SUV3
MQRPTLSICLRCQSCLLPTTQLVQRRFRKVSSSPRKRRKLSESNYNAYLSPPSAPLRFDLEKDDVLATGNTVEFFKRHVLAWTKDPDVHARLSHFGVPAGHIEPLLAAFADFARKANQACTGRYHLDRFSNMRGSLDKRIHLDKVYTSIFYLWAADEENESKLLKVVPFSTIYGMRRLSSSVNLRNPSEMFPFARNMHRKIIMHVGPTNSGKTHTALRALAGARTGVYAGPLRLLAHEIWDRLNNGQIVPLGVDPSYEGETGKVESDEKTNFDILPESNRTATVRKEGSAKYARMCNLVTGEEQKIVHENAPLTSMTVEMVSVSSRYDVGVIDEIQMIADQERGGAWTDALLGLCARELHLCGEETAVAIVEALIRDTGDELVVHRYNRLSPLEIEEESLRGNLRHIRPGDCVVTFTRHNIFALKKSVEEMTKLRCAVVYGALPPEVRSEQAALFNDAESSYDVLIGSDAVGMGLNLCVSVFHFYADITSLRFMSRKIRRVVFEALAKFDGTQSRLLSTSQIKQIAGRAGRYGLLSDDPRGFVTTLHAKDLPLLRAALASPPVPLQFARYQHTKDLAVDVSEALPSGATLNIVQDVINYIGQFSSVYTPVRHSKFSVAANFLDRHRLSIRERFFFVQAPIAWRDAVCMTGIEAIFRLYCERLSVNVTDTLENSRLLETLQDIEEMMKRPTFKRKHLTSRLSLLESLHRILTLYMWLSYRNSVVFTDNQTCQELKGRVEKAMEWTLHRISWDGKKVKLVEKEGEVKYWSWHDQRKREALERLSTTHERFSIAARP